MEAEQILEVIEKLTGPVEPAGATHIDNERYENLLTYIEVLDVMHSRISDIAWDNRGRHEASIKKAVAECNAILDRLAED